VWNFGLDEDELVEEELVLGIVEPTILEGDEDFESEEDELPKSMDEAPKVVWVEEPKLIDIWDIMHPRIIKG
jgi:hypothetical protein